MKKSLMNVVLIGMVAGSTWVGTSCSQTTEAQAPATAPPVDQLAAQLPAVAQPPAEAPALAPAADYFSHIARTDDAIAGPYGAGGGRSEIGAIVHQLRATEDEATKAQLAKKLEKAVADSFEQDMKNREAELAKLEARLNKLRAQLERRRKAKDEITQLQVKVLTNDAEGLGFSDAVSAGPASNAAPYRSWASPSELESRGIFGEALPHPTRPPEPTAIPRRSDELK